MSIISLSINQKDKIAIIAPHPDDECIGVGGIISLYPNQCDVFVMTDGSQGQKNVASCVERKIRRKQFENEMRYAKVHSYFWLGYEDGTLLGKNSCMKEIDFSKYSKIFLPWDNDNHPDHTATYIYALEKIQQECGNKMEVYQYEIHVPFHDVTHYIDITDVIDKKKHLIQFHDDQVKSVCYDEIAIALAKYRACQANQPHKFYETFIKTDINEKVFSKEFEEREKLIQKYRQFYRLFLRWIRIEQNGENIPKYLKEKNINKISVYGYGDVGKLLYNELINTNIVVTEILDKRDIRTENNLVIKKPHHGNRDVDAIIVTAISYFDEIKKELSQLGYKNIISLQKLVEEMDDGV